MQQLSRANMLHVHHPLPGPEQYGRVKPDVSDVLWSKRLRFHFGFESAKLDSVESAKLPFSLLEK
jgi:hypothetical protein